MNTRIPLAAGAALTAALALTGCSSTRGSAGGGMSGMDMPSTAAPTSASAKAHDAADVMFAQMMIPHHLQAVEMADMVLKKTGVDPKVTALATKIKQAQSPEIDQMNTFLTSYGLPKVTASGMSGTAGMGHGGGMMSAADMDALDRAGGAKASTLFLTQMTVHHSSAITMAQTEAKDGKDPAAVALARKIVTDQTAEIATMKKLSAQLS